MSSLHGAASSHHLASLLAFRHHVCQHVRASRTLAHIPTSAVRPSTDCTQSAKLKVVSDWDDSTCGGGNKSGCRRPLQQEVDWYGGIGCGGCGMLNA